VSADSERLQQVVWNILSNAVKFTPRNGRVEITLAPVADGVQLVVRDDGIGIAREFLPHIFERFRQQDSSTTRERGGLGLGLGIARQLVELHGGTIDAASEGPGTGATFRVVLPALADRIEPPRRAGTSAPPPPEPLHQLHGVRVLVVDDDDDALAMVRDILEAAPSTWRYIESINNHILTGELYKALKDAKKLISYEGELLEIATRNAGLSDGSEGDRKSA